jgi:hypothetical protein
MYVYFYASFPQDHPRLGLWNHGFHDYVGIRIPEGPEALSARCSAVVEEVISEVALATPRLLSVQDS